jgi:crotonobetainyl-CoA:carnitine CoA-transferase CaiB-like acyl-CoA transferase
MFENMAAYIMQEHLGAASFRPPLGPPGDHRVLSPDGKPLPTSDGFICISANTDAQAHAFFDAIGRSELKADPRFATIAGRVSHTKDYFHIRATSLGGRTTAEWMEIFDRMDVPAAPYNTIASLIDDPHLRAVGMVREEDHPTEGATWAIGAPNRLSGGMAPPRSPAPRLGADGACVLAQAGLSADEIDTMRRDGVLIEAKP